MTNLNNPTEIWKDVKGFEGRYQISNLGRVKSLSRLILHRSGRYLPSKEIILLPLLNGAYPRIALYKDGASKRYSIHRLVAEAFIDNPHKKKCVNHKNGIKTDNRVENLEWVTYSENASHAFANGLTYSLKGEKHHQSKLNNKDVLDIRLSYKLGCTQKELAHRYCVSFQHISDIIRRNKWTHI